MELLTVIKFLAARGRGGARPNPSIIFVCVVYVLLIILSELCTLYALCAPP